MNYDFRGRTAVITGGAQGIGSAVVRRMITAGAQVAILDQIAVKSAQIVPVDGLISIAADVTRPDEVDDATRQIVDRFGRIDMLVNSAGIAGPNAPLWQYDVVAWRRVIEIDLVGTFLACRACVPQMLKTGWGRIVNISSIAGKEGNPNASAYSAAKAGVLGMTKSLGKELAARIFA